MATLSRSRLHATYINSLIRNSVLSGPSNMNVTKASPHFVVNSDCTHCISLTPSAATLTLRVAISPSEMATKSCNRTSCSNFFTKSSSSVSVFVVILALDLCRVENFPT
ncbi:hypothetical protein JTE90_002087 [Oedothorax gibbosus]|uniref:Uncharacterized protein n=1 Tax=Oedothorax gibbosus TaxID=931172 RepID=A0AAV6UFL2_9ARAC|nr:hypothetical protein JTE90_002087 [Oedothorax gibbosus]